MTRTRLYRGGVLESENFPLGDIPGLITAPDVTLWVDLCAPGAAELAIVSDAFGLHHLAVEAATHEHQRPKLDRCDNHLILGAYAVRLDVPSGRLETCAIAAFITRNTLLTVHSSDRFDIDAVVARWDDSPDLARHGVGILLYGLLDYIVDTHFTAVQILDDEIEALEDLLFARTPRARSVQLRSFRLRKSLVRFRRVVLPMREVVNSLLRRDLHLLDEAMTPYYQDVYDHVLRVSEWTENLREMVSAVLDTNLSLQSNRLNIITKQVTSWAAIIAVPTAITGFYGQNVPYPGYQSPWGFYTSTGAILIISGVLYLLFRRRGWL
ncbi:MAG: magnesium transporter CorA family protein [Pseudonocardiaceae bacterium]